MSEQNPSAAKLLDPGERQYDVVVIGAGAVGENVADRVAQAGLSVVIVEADLVGGECSYWACMPSKVLLRSGAVLRAAALVAGARSAVTGPADVKAVLARRDDIASHWHDDGQVNWLGSAGIHLVRGHARLAGPRRVVVVGPDGETTLLARHAVALSTGSSALIPPIRGLAAAHPWTSREATSVTDIPTRLAIIGGGVVAMEMATAYRDLGSEVTVLVRDGALTARGVDVRIAAEVVSVTRQEHGVVLELGNGDRLVTDEVLVATGRTPNSQDLGLETVDLTSGQWLLTHQGKYQARAAGDRIAARALGSPTMDGPWQPHTATADQAAVPQVTFTDPEVASVGLSSVRAQADLDHVRIVDYDLGAIAGAAVHAEGYAGRARFVIDEDQQVLVGATFVGPDVAELLHSATIAIVGEVPLHRLWHAVPAYPTISEVWLRLLESYGRQSAWTAPATQI